VRFVAAYPITPATELLEWMAPALEQVGGVLVQAEDELASINMALGASYGGVPSLTATSGPGLSLMTEALGLAVAAELPVVVVDVMRGGPSTGIPAKSEQSDISIATQGLHGDAPRLVVVPNSIEDCLVSTQWAVHLAESLQVPALVLSDQFFGQTRAVVDRPAMPAGGRLTPSVALAAADAAKLAEDAVPALCRYSQRSVADGGAGHAGHHTRLTAWSTTNAVPRPARPPITAASSTSASASRPCLMGTAGPTAKAQAIWW
jgi:pyruvate/2-oxoacid:ferredoxin oxidoreductase alpha subunit